MGNWADLNLPPPEAPAYLFAIDAGLQRTPFTTAKPRQRRKYETNRRNFAVEVLLTQAQLVTAESFIQCYGYTWFTIPLLSGQEDGNAVSNHQVRLVDSYQVTAVGWNLYKLTLPLEGRQILSLMLTTQLYPLESGDSARFTAPAFSALMWSQPLDEAAFTPPSILSATHVQTLWTGEYDAGFEAAEFTPPAIGPATLVQTFFPVSHDAGFESAAFTPPSIISATNVQTLFPLGYNAGFEPAAFTPPTFTGTLQ